MLELKKSDQIAAYIYREIERGNWKPGDRIPTERELAKHFALSRNTVRKCLDRLESEGTLYRHVGRGTFISEGGASQHPIAVMNADSCRAFSLEDPEGLSPADVIECRMLFEPSFAHLVAARATLGDIDRIAYCYERCDTCVGVVEFEKWDEAFHDAIAVASHNQSIVMLTRNLAKVRQREDWLQLKSLHFDEARQKKLQQQHLLILEAIRHRDSQKVREALKMHLSGIQQSLFEGN